jgi:hypothetical protein
MDPERRRRKIPTFEIDKIKKSGFVLFRCEKRGNQLFFWCPYCFEEHAHGLAAQLPFETTSRSIHCRSEAAQKAFGHGYFIFYER